MKLDDFITKRHDDLVELIAKIKAKYPNRKSKELITDLWLECVKKNMIVNNENDYWFFAVKFMKNRLNWSDGFDVEIKENGKITYKTHKKIKKIEMDNTYEKEYNDVYLNDRLDDEQVEKIKKVYKIYDNMDFYDRHLFELYFIDKLSVDAITKIMNKTVPISRSSVYNMILELIKKIKSKI